MPQYVIERQYLLPIYEHLLIEAPNLDAACREALDEFAHPWSEAAEQDFDNARTGEITRAVELPDPVPRPLWEDDDLSDYPLSRLLYSSGLEPLSIPAEFVGDDSETANWPKRPSALSAAAKLAEGDT
jgi:hypothetical protein